MLQQQPIETPNDVWIKRWSVVGTSGKNYTVALKNDGTYGCDCPSWKFQKKNLSGQRNPCQHILRILLQIRLENGEGSSVSTPRRENFTVKKVTVDPLVTRRIRFEK